MSDSNPPQHLGGEVPSPLPGRYPATLAVDLPEKIARWRVIGNIVLAIPHFVIVYALAIVAEIVAIVAWFAGVITGKVPESLLGIIAMYLRYQSRVTVYASFMTEAYPPFSFSTAFTDPGDYPSARVDVSAESTGRNRLTIFFRLILAIPHFIVLSILGVITYVVYIIAWFAVLITGSWPQGLRAFVIGYLRWSLRVSAYMMLATDKYPPLNFEE